MKLSIHCVRAILLATALFAVPAISHADTYQIFDLGYGYRSSLVGITDSGTVVIGIGEVDVYETWVNGEEVSVSATNPDLTYDDGTACASVPAGFSFISRCNNGHEVYGTDRYAAAPYASMIFDGPDLATDFVADGELDQVYLNASGDFVFIYDEGALGPDGDGFIAEAIDVTTGGTPEPGSLWLLATGAIAGVGVVGLRRREGQGARAC